MRRIALFRIATLTLAGAPLPVNAATFSIIYAFDSHSGDGYYPYAGLISDSAGNLYGTTYGGGLGYGTVYELSPPAAGQSTWTEQVLYSFAPSETHADCNEPQSHLVIGSNGALYGTCIYGGGKNGAGVVFEVAPPTKESSIWRETLIHVFTGKKGDGASPVGALAIDANGVLYGATSAGGNTVTKKHMQGYGILFSLTPPAGGTGPWTETILHNFGTGSDQAVNPKSDVLLAGGVLFGTTANSKSLSGKGTVWEAAPPIGGTGPWTEAVILNLPGGPRGSSPVAGLAINSQGTLYGTASQGYGTIFSLSPPGANETKWKETVLADFSQTKFGPPDGGVLVAGGDVFGTLLSGGKHSYGTVFELTPPSGGGHWPATTLYNFPTVFSNGFDPVGNLLLDQSGELIGVTESGGPDNAGEVYAISP